MSGNSSTGKALTPVVQFPTGRDSVTVPFQLIDDRTIVDVKVEGLGPLPFFLDTGTSSSLLDTSLAEMLRLKSRGEFSDNIGGGGGETKVDLVQDVTLQVGGLVSRHRNIMAIKIDSIAHRAAGLDIFGILGGSFIRNFVLDLDYERQEVTFFNRASHTWKGQGDRIKLAVLSGVPFAGEERARQNHQVRPKSPLRSTGAKYFSSRRRAAPPESRPR